MSSFSFIMAAGEGAGGAGFDWGTIILLAALAGLMFFMFRSNKKRQKAAQELQDRIEVGVDVLTSFGVYGTIIGINEEDDSIELQTSPGTVMRVHRQVVGTILTPQTPELDSLESDADALDESDEDKK